MIRRGLAILAVAVLLGVPALSRAADELNESQNPQEYTDEDSQPLRLLSYAMQPVGFVLEWTVMRPLHYLASETPLAPALDSEYRFEGPPAAIAELPSPDYLPNHDPITAPPPLRGETTNAKAPPQYTPPPPISPKPPQGWDTSRQRSLLR